MAAEILYSSTAVRAAIIDLFSKAKGRRVAISAFVGSGAEAYLPRLKMGGLELYCWPKAGGTNPNALRTLKKGGAKISFIDSLHMKVYWAKGEGAVITSANLSTNALGAGDLKEIGVRFGPRQVDIDRILRSMKTRAMSLKELLKMDRDQTLLAARTRGLFKGTDRSTSFKEWYSSPMQRTWKLGPWEESFEPSKTCDAFVKTEYGLNAPQWVLGAQYGDFVDGDWILSFRIAKRTLSDLCWTCADNVIRVPKSDKNYDPEEPYEAIQVRSLKYHPSPPFKLDGDFRRVFKIVAKKYGFNRLSKQYGLKPKMELLNMLSAQL